MTLTWFKDNKGYLANVPEHVYQQYAISMKIFCLKKKWFLSIAAKDSPESCFSFPTKTAAQQKAQQVLEEIVGEDNG